LGGEDHIMDAALTRHFRSSDPACWKFTTASSAAAVGAVTPATVAGAPLPQCEYGFALSSSARKTMIRMDVQQERLPLYVTRSFYQMKNTDGIRFCKRLPPPESFVVSRAERDEAANLKPYAKRRKIEEAAAQQFEPAGLEGGVWQKVGLSIISLPACLRPGRGFR